MTETIIINLMDPSIAQLTTTYLSRRFEGYSFKVARYYSEYHHVVTNREVPKEQLTQMEAYGQGVSDVLRKLIEP